MKIAIRIFFLVIGISEGFSQLTKIHTGISSDLVELSLVGNQVIVNDTWGYCVKSNDECNTLTSVYLPGSTNLIKRLQRLDTNNYLLLAYDVSETRIYKSANAGNAWVQKFDTTGAYDSHFCFFDAAEGIVTRGHSFIRTNNASTSWYPGTMTISGSAPASMNMMKSFDDSIVCIGQGNFSIGSFYISKDRGNTWPYSWFFTNSTVNYGNMPADIFFLNKDTIVVVSNNGEFSKSKDGGSTFTNSMIPLVNSRGLCFKNKNEGYVVGSNSQSQGVILKTTDFGQTWWTFNTGYYTTLLNMIILNDSVAILSGTNGILLKWKYKNSLFTGMSENVFERAQILLFPNPANDKIQISLGSNEIKEVDVEVSNVLGQRMYSIKNLSCSESLDISNLCAGTYYFLLKSKSYEKVFKVIKQ